MSFPSIWRISHVRIGMWNKTKYLVVSQNALPVTDAGRCMRASGFCGTRETLICGTRVHGPRRINAWGFGMKVFANVCVRHNAASFRNDTSPRTTWREQRHRGKLLRVYKWYQYVSIKPSVPPCHPSPLILVLPPNAQPSPGRSNVLGLRLPCDRVTLRRNDGTEVIAIDQTTLTASLYPLPPFLRGPFPPPPPPDLISSAPRLLTRQLAPRPRIIPDERYFVPDLARNPYFSHRVLPSIFIREIRRRFSDRRFVST